MAKVDICKARLNKVPEIIKRFRQAVLADAVSGKLTEDWRETNNLGLNYSEKVRQIRPTAKVRRGVPENVRIPDIISGWKYPRSWIALPAAELLRKSIIYDLKDGNHGSNHPKKEDFSDKGLPFITAAQVSNFKIDYENAPKLFGTPLNKLRVGFAKENDVILTHKGTVGRVAICDRDCILTPQTTYYRIDFDLIDPNYLEIFLLSPKFQKQLDQIKSQTTRDFVPVTAQYSLFHLLPPIEEQREIISHVKSLFALADSLEQRFEKAILRVEKLTASILSKAFRGELVPQAPNDEPAEMLLKRIRAERKAIAATKKKRGRSPKKRSDRDKKNQAQKAEAEVEPEPVTPKPAKAGSAKVTARATKPRKQAPKPIEKRFEKADLLKAFRKAIFRRNGLDDDSLLRLVGHRLGVRRLSKPIRRELETALPTALRRNIITRDSTGYYGATPTIQHYDDAELIKALRSVIRRGYEYEREHLTAEAAAYLGFDKVSDAFAEKMKTVFRLAIRRGLLYRNGIYVGKV